MTISLTSLEPPETPQTPRARRRRATFERAVEEALAIVADDGLQDLTLKRVSKRLDYTETALYRYFPNKAALIAAMARSAIATLHSDLRELARAHADEPLVVAWAAALLYDGLAQSRPAHFALLSQTFGDPRQLVDETTAADTIAALSALFADLGRVLVAATDDGALDGARNDEDTADQRALALWSAVHGTMTVRKLERFRASAAEAAPVVRLLVRTLLTGWGASPERVRAAELEALSVLEAWRSQPHDG